MPRKQQNRNVRPMTEANANRQKRKNQRRRSKRQNKNNLGGNKPRSPATIINTLTKSMNKMSIQTAHSGKPYVQARLHCCVPRSLPRVPDGSNNRILKICFYSVDRLSFTGTGAKTATLQFNPWVPCPGMLVSPSGDVIVNGFNPGVNPGIIGVGFGLPQQFASLPKNHTAPGSSANAFDIYDAATIRIVAQTHAIRYTGPVNTCSGVIRAWENENALNEAGQVTTYSATSTQPASGISGQVFGTSSAWTRSVPIGTQILAYDGASALTTIPATAMSGRPEQGMSLRLAHKTNNYKYVPVMNVPPLVCPYSAMSSTTAANGYHLFYEATANLPNIFAYDNDWTGMNVLLDSVNADASFSIESCVCVEISPIATSPFYPLGDSTAVSDPASIKHVQNVIAAEGPAKLGIN